MEMREIWTRLAEWYEGQGYADKSLADAESVFSMLCDFAGMRSDYTPQAGRSYVEYASGARGYSKSHMKDVRRAVYVFDCLASHTPIRAQRPRRGPSDVPDGAEAVSIPMSELRQLILDWRDDPLRDGPPKATLYVLGHVAHHVGLARHYTPGLGRAFLEHMGRGDYGDAYLRSLRRKVYLLDCVVSGEPVRVMRPREGNGTAPRFGRVVEEYAEHCRRGGNKAGTVTQKRRYAERLLDSMESCGCRDLSELTPDVVLRACLAVDVTGCRSYHRTFLRYLFDAGVVATDYSPLVPGEHRGERLPDVYDRDEILRLEASCDRGTDRGKRNYAMVLMASRLKLRPSDIVSLRFDEVDLEGGVLRITQEKTGVGLTLPIVPELGDALADYIAVRPESDSPYVFLRSRAPYLPMGGSSVRDITTRGLESAGVEPRGRGTGPRALRSSGAAHMVNGGESYRVVQESLGQRCRDVVRHYARLDIAHLRMSALEPPSVTTGSFLERFLAGEESL